MNPELPSAKSVVAAAGFSERRGCEAWLVGLLLCIALTSCSKAPGPDALVLTEIPVSPKSPPVNVLDMQYPAGSRVILTAPPYGRGMARSLSKGLYAAGAPVLSYDGRTVLFSGKATPAAEWQIYRATLASGNPHKLTAAPGGAMQPAPLPDGRIVFASPVPKLIGRSDSGASGSALYAQFPGKDPSRLTFCPGSASDPLVLPDGRIAFVYSPPPQSGVPPGFYTINNDGTEIEALACTHDPPGALARPRQLPDGRLVFVSGGADHGCGTAEFIRLAKPFSSRAPLLPGGVPRAFSVQPAPGGAVLVCAAPPGQNAGPSAVYKLEAASTDVASPLVADAAWSIIEALPATPGSRPMGRLSNMEPTRQTGQLLCLNANQSTYRGSAGQAVQPAGRVRVLAERAPGVTVPIGEVPVQSDGSFMAEVPADRPLGFEALDADGRVLRHVDPMIWVRPGENRACLGCHAGHNRAPHNHRPLAVRVPVPRLGLEPAAIAKSP